MVLSQQRSGATNRGHQRVDVRGSVVDGERRAGGGGNAKSVHDRLRAVVTGSYRDALAIHHGTDVVRVNYIIPRAKDWAEIAPILGQYFGDIRPASTAIIAGLIDPRMRIEIEVTARRRAKERRGHSPRRKRG